MKDKLELKIANSGIEPTPKVVTVKLVLPDLADSMEVDGAYVPSVLHTIVAAVCAVEGAERETD